MFVSDFNKPLILQSDFSLLLDVHNPLFDEARGRLSAFAELEKSPEHIHTYRMSPLSLWNAASAGLTSESILETLSLYSRFPVPPSVRAYIESTVSKFGKIVLIDGGEGKIEIQIEDERVRREILSQKTIIRLIAEENGKLFVPLLKRRQPLPESRSASATIRPTRSRRFTVQTHREPATASLFCLADRERPSSASAF